MRRLLPRLWLSESAGATIKQSAASTHPRETGGVLLGVYTTAGRPWVCQAVVIPSRKSTPTYYDVVAGARPEAVEAARVHDMRLGYLGDWHSHPADVGPSAVDRATMQRIGADPDAHCAHPLLIIARRDAGGGYRLDARQLARRRLRQLHVIAAGDLPVQSSNSQTAQ